MPSFSRQMVSISSFKPGVIRHDRIERSRSWDERMARVWSLLVLIDLANTVESVMNRSRLRVSVDAMGDSMRNLIIY